MKFPEKLKAVHIIMIIFFVTNLFFLTNFPFVHSDEAWLSGLSRNILAEKDLSVTEPFFDLYPRHPHAVKSLFHLIQIIFIKLMGYSIFTFRFISLLAGTAALYLFYKLAKHFTRSDILANTAAVIMSLDIQFIYAAHFARQEIILLLILLIALTYFLSKYRYQNTTRQDIVMGLMLGTGIGIHPNSFIIALAFIVLYTYNLLITKKIKLHNYLAFGGTLAGIALFFVTLSFHFDANFIQNYSSYGQKLGIFSSILTKFDRLDYFYQKLFYRVSGTYYIPPVKFQFALFALTIVFIILQVLFKKDKKNIPLLLIFLGINTAYVLIGRYNQTSIIFIFPVCYLMLLNIISIVRKKYMYIITTILIIVLALNTTATLTTDSHDNYDNYLREISSVVGKNKRVLANLNADYYFNNGRLFDYRNLAFLKENNLEFKDYINTNKIEYIIYPEEMDFIYNNRPVWNILYGNIYPYYQDMKEFLDNNCQLVHEFTNKTYGIRITKYIGKQEWKIKIYQVKEHQ